MEPRGTEEIVGRTVSILPGFSPTTSSVPVRFPLLDPATRDGIPMKDLAKRKRVMARSMRLGHCICNAKKSCPCDVFHATGHLPLRRRVGGRAGRAGPSDEHGAERRLRVEDRQGDAQPRVGGAAVLRRPASARRGAGRRRRGRVPARRRRGAGANRRRLLAVGRRSVHLRADCGGQFA